MSRVPSRVVELIETFGRDVEAYHSQQYNETQLRREFIDPFFEELGWDVTNKAGYAQAYKDVIHEDAIKVGGATKAPDYCFRIGGVRKFFLEAKKPSVNIKGDPHPAYQLRRYAWSAKLPLSILTDFEEFAVYDCQTRPKQTDKADTARIMYFTYKHYPDKWAKIADVFSREAILKGSFDKFAVATKGKRGTTTVDTEFLKEIETWRRMLARIIALRNRSLSRDEINFAVQRTIDRIIFLRMCEDRGIEDYGQLLKISSGDRTYPRLCEIFEKADQRYNSGLFHFHDESDRPEAPDKLTPNLVIDDGKLKWILHSLYYPQSPYEFSVLPPEILGNVYEQFLGSVITISGAHRADVVPKPEVKKAGGVYYTPSYIVDYIVKNTVGKLLGGPDCHCEERSDEAISNKLKTKNSKPCPERSRRIKTPRQVANLRILDPACGSGSFLLGAYTYLLNYHRDWYVENDPQKHTKKIYQGKGGQWYLTNAEKKRILLNNIFGVDIDSQAVEVTKLSLLLKVLEGEDAQTLENQYRLFHERALPDLATNIKCGNSLIGPDFFETVVIPSADHTVIPSAAEESIKITAAKRPQKRLAPAPVVGGSHKTTIPNDLYKKINPFDWHAEFPQIFSGKTPGFDAVIGNPPYVRIQTMKETQPQSVPYFSSKYHSASKGNYDIYVVFVEKALQLLNNRGRMGYILPHKFFNAKYGQPLRNLISKGKHLTHIVHFGDQQVFAGATTYTCLLFLNKYQTNECNIIQISSLSDWLISGQATTGYVSAKTITDSEWNFVVDSGAALFERLKNIALHLGEVSHLFVGLQTSADPIYILQLTEEREQSFIAYSKSLETEVELERGICKLLLKGSDIHRYRQPLNQSILIFPYIITNEQAIPLKENDLRNRFPNAYNYLRANRDKLLCRANSKKESWFLYTYPKNLSQFASSKLMTGVLALKASFTLDTEGTYYFVGGGNAGGYGIRLRAQVKLQHHYLLGLLNSSLLDYFLKKISTRFRGGYYSYARRFIEQIPIRTIDFDNPYDKAKHDKMVKLVERMLDLHKKLAADKIPDDKTRIQRQIATTDKQIDNLVYELYGLTDEEIVIVKGK